MSKNSRTILIKFRTSYYRLQVQNRKWINIPKTKDFFNEPKIADEFHYKIGTLNLSNIRKKSTCTVGSTQYIMSSYS